MNSLNNQDDKDLGVKIIVELCFLAYNLRLYFFSK